MRYKLGMWHEDCSQRVWLLMKQSSRHLLSLCQCLALGLIAFILFTARGGFAQTCSPATCFSTNPCVSAACTWDPLQGRSVCSFADRPSGAACTTDNNACTTDTCDGAGTCKHT